MEESSPTFKKCLVKKSKLYYKTEALIVGMLIIGTVLLVSACWALATFQFNSTLLLFVALDVIVIGVISFGVVIGKPNPVEEFLKLFIALHVFLATVVVLFLAEIVAYFIIPIIVVFLANSILMKFDGWIMLIGIGIALILVLPVNHALFVCGKIDPWINAQLKNIGNILGDYICLN